MIVIGSMDVGGAETHLTRTLPFLNSPRRRKIACFRNGGVLAERLREQGVEVSVPNFPTKFVSIRVINKILNLFYSAAFIVRETRDFQPDVAHYFLPEAYLLGGFLSFFVGPRRKVMSRRSRNFYQRRNLCSGLSGFFIGKWTSYSPTLLQVGLI